MLKHVVFQVGMSRGRVAVLYDEDKRYLVVKSIGGCHPPIEILFSILDATIYGWREKALDAFRLSYWKDYDWGVEVIRSRFGGVTFLTKRLIDEELFSVKTTARLHVSCFGKFRVLEGELSELAPILEEVKPSQVVLQMQDDYMTWEGTLNGEFIQLTVVRLSEEFDGFKARWRRPDLSQEQPQEPEEERPQEQIPEVEVI